MIRAFVGLLAIGLSACAGNTKIAGVEVRPVGAAPTVVTGLDAGLEAARQHMSRGNDILAIEMLRKANRVYPDNPRVLNALAVAYDRIGRFDVSRRFYERAMGLAPELDYIAHNFGYSLQLQSRFAEAQVFLARSAASTDPDVQARSGVLVRPAEKSQYALANYRVLAAENRITRRTEHVQFLSIHASPKPDVSATLDVSAGLAFAAIEDDRATAAGDARGSRLRQDWEQLTLAALGSLDNRDRQPASTFGGRSAIAFTSVGMHSIWSTVR